MRFDRAYARVGGHYWTLRRALEARLRPRPLPGANPWSSTVADDGLGPVALTGAMHRQESDTVLVIVHGLGGSAESYYCHTAAWAGLAAGFDVLRMNLRGADGSGADVYHAGLTADLHACLAALEHPKLLLLGVSMGGHIGLWTSLQSEDSRLRAVAAVCPPLDLAQGCRDIDRRRRRLYRDEVLRSLLAAARPAIARGRVPLALDALSDITSLRRWDERVVVPRHGLGDVDAYHRAMSVGPQLGTMARPSLVVLARYDPMVLAETNATMLRRHPPSPSVEVRWLDAGGHVGFPPDIDLGAPGPLGVYPQVVAWLGAHARLT
ncbi:MAG: alpha/beta fold hydrolase [Myxococcota bacterium]